MHSFNLWPHARVRHAFTLVELLVVIAIIGLLMAILLPSLSSARTQGKRAVVLGHLRGIGQAMAAYQNDNRDEHPALLEREEKAFLGLSLLARDYQFPVQFLINPNTADRPATAVSADGRPILADLDGVEITPETPIKPADLPRVRWHCSFAYDNDNKRGQRRTVTAYNTYQAFVYVGDRADYALGRTFSGNWEGEGMCLLWSDGHAEFRRRKSLPGQSDPNIYHHNEYQGEGGEEVVDGVAVTEYTLDTHLRFFSEEEDDELLPD